MVKKGDSMKPNKLLLRCYANKEGDQWQVFCIDFNLAAQGDSFSEARIKLRNMISDYLYDALAGEDQEYADQLLQRRAPLKIRVTYYYYKLMYKLGMLKNGIHRLFTAPVPLVPQNCTHE